MKFLLSLDYELFFGRNTGSVQACLIDPIDALLKVTDKYDVKLVLFVDAGYILRAAEQADEYPVLAEEVNRIKQQLSTLAANGHDIQLHVHPHWLDSRFDGTQWHIDTSRYRLHDFARDEIKQIIKQQTELLSSISGKPVFAYRAGGWCIQPFTAMKEALQAAGVWLDSTVYPHGLSEDDVRGYDFRDAPYKSSWRFDDDPVQEAANGHFVEIPISACKLSPLFFWKMAFAKKLAGQQHRPYGDGNTMVANSSYYLSRLTSSTYSVASIDGLKASTLAQALKQTRRWGNNEIFNAMGHPKSLTPYSVQQVGAFLAKHASELEPVTFQDFIHLKSASNNQM